jgi:cytoskeleton protein RodZ
MSENVDSLPSRSGTAGSLLKAAREQQGIHLAVLAAAIKISTRKLDALEGDRYGELPDPAFTRALAQTVARALKIDPLPVLALLPPAASAEKLEAMSDGLNTPFKDRNSPTELSALIPRAPLVWAGLALLAAAALLLYWPYTSTTPLISSNDLPAAQPSINGSATSGSSSAGTGSPSPAAALAPAPSVASGVEAARPAAVAEATLPAQPVAAANPGASSADSANVVVTEAVWLEVIDGTGQVVFMRTLQPGEVVNFDERLPLRLKLGNAPAAKVTFRGETIDLGPLTRGSVARVVLK